MSWGRGCPATPWPSAVLPLWQKLSKKVHVDQTHVVGLWSRLVPPNHCKSYLATLMACRRISCVFCYITSKTRFRLMRHCNRFHQKITFLFLNSRKSWKHPFLGCFEPFSFSWVFSKFHFYMEIADPVPPNLALSPGRAPVTQIPLDMQHLLEAKK